jgi:LysR family transcriptional activator of dmlA
MRPNQLTDVQYDGIQLFAHVARSGSIAAAARSLGITASTATRKLIALERALNVRLFNRSTRSLSLTEAGAMALEWAQSSLISLEEVADNIAAMTGAPSGLIRIAVPHFGMNSYLPPVLSSFSKVFPKISIDVTTTDDLINLIDENFDLVIRYGILPDSRNVAIRLTEFERIVCASPGYLARFGYPGELSDLAHHHCVVHRQSDTRTWTFGFGEKIIHQPISARFTVDNAYSLELFAVNDAGIARLPTTTIRRNLDNGRLVRLFADYRCVEPSGDAPSIWLVHAGRQLPHRVRLLIDHLKREIPQERQKLYDSMARQA